MKSSILVVFAYTLFFPLFSLAQKAYENVAYCGKVNHVTVFLNLANGYIGASEIKVMTNKTLKFIPEVNAVDENGKLKFLPVTTAVKPTPGYFIIRGMLESYEKLPKAIRGIYYINGKRLNVIFYKLK